VTAKQIAVKRYVVKLGDDECERLNAMVRAGKHPAPAVNGPRRSAWPPELHQRCADWPTPASACSAARFLEALLHQPLAGPRNCRNANIQSCGDLAVTPSRRRLRRHLPSIGCALWSTAKQANAAFVAGMKDVLEVYHSPHDPHVRLSVSTNPQSDLSAKHACQSLPSQDAQHV
jgi:hypothetical protein